MKIGFIGTGDMAKALSRKWHGKHQLFFGGRDPAKTAAFAQGFGGLSGSLSDAVAFGEVIVLSTPADAVLDAVDAAGQAPAFAGKIVLDITNPISVETFLTTRESGGSLTEAIAERLPAALVGKAFNLAHTSVWDSDDMTFDGRRLVTLFTADDGAADAIAELIEDVGSEPLRLGGNEHAYQLEAAAAIVIKFLFSGRPSNTVFNFIQPEVKPVR